MFIACDRRTSLTKERAGLASLLRMEMNMPRARTSHPLAHLKLYWVGLICLQKWNAELVALNKTTSIMAALE